MSDEAITTNRSAAAATIFSRVWAAPPPFTSHPAGSTWSAPSIAMSSRSRRVERLDREPELAGRRLGLRRGRDAADVEPPLGQRGEEVGDRRAGPEPDRHAVLDELGGELRGALLFGFHRFREGSLATRLPSGRRRLGLDPAAERLLELPRGRDHQVVPSPRPDHLDADRQASAERITGTLTAGSPSAFA